MKNRIWLNNKHDNSEGNMCMCPNCRYQRKRDTGWEPTLEESFEWFDILERWEHRSDGMDKIMKGRFSDGDA